MNGILLETDPIMRRRQTFYFDHDAREFVFHNEYDVEPVVEMAKGLHAMVDERARYGELDKVAQVPLVILFDWQREWDRRGLSEDEREKDLRKKLDDRDNLFMRTRPGRLSK